MSIKKCTFCGREGSEGDNTKVVGGYTILDSCTDCEKEIFDNELADLEKELPDILSNMSQEDLEEELSMTKHILCTAITMKRMLEVDKSLKALGQTTDNLLEKSAENVSGQGDEVPNEVKFRKAQYVIVDSKGRYFKEISKLNKIVYADNMEEATKMDFSDTEELLPLIEHYTGCVAVAEPVSQEVRTVLKRVRAIVNNYDEEPTYNGDEYNVLQESDTEYLIEIDNGILLKGRAKVWKNKTMFKDVVNS
jgi:hypothetical protein